MILDLDGNGQVNTRADVIVIGGGTVGLPFSVNLADMHNKQVVCLESGGQQQACEQHPLNEVIHLAAEYKGASAGRFRCIGGTSTRWGGALIPFQAADLTHSNWPLSFDELEPFVTRVEDMFGLPPGPYEDQFFPIDLGSRHINRLAKWPAFRLRNVAHRFGPAAAAAKSLNVWLNATVSGIHVSRLDGSIEITAHSPRGDRLCCIARRLVIAAGAIESTRLALMIDIDDEGSIRHRSPCLGRYFSDHLSVPVAEIEPLHRHDLNRLVGFRFGQNGGMRNIRFELNPEAAERALVPPCFAHIAFESSQSGGFDALRDVYRSLQKGHLPRWSEVSRLLGHLPWLARAAWWRSVHHRLLYPDDSRLFVHMVVEQIPLASNRITLSRDRTDSLGMPLAQIEWKVANEDLENVVRSSRLFETTWKESSLSHLGNWRSLEEATIRHSLLDSGGIYHPTGSTRMGLNASDGVVDRDLQMFGLPQVQILSTSVLPTGGGANPTMMLLLLAVRCLEGYRTNRTT